MSRADFDHYYRRYGRNINAHLIAYPDVEYFEAREAEGLIGFSRLPGFLIALGDPLADASQFGAVLGEFLAYARGERAAPCFILASPEFRPVAEGAEMWALKIGEQFIFDLSGYRPRGKAAKKVRSAANKARRLGATVRELHPTGEPDDADTRAIQGVADRWLGGKATTADLFMLGLHLFESREYKRYFVSFLDGTPQAVLVCSPIPGRQGVLFEDMPRLRDAEVSTSELLVLSTLETLRQEGLKMASSGCSPHIDPRDPPMPFLARLALSAFMPLVHLALPLPRIYHYHRKFATPLKEDTYLISPKRFPFFRIIMAVLASCNFSLLPNREPAPEPEEGEEEEGLARRGLERV